MLVSTLQSNRIVVLLVVIVSLACVAAEILYYVSQIDRPGNIGFST